jgi:transposase
MTVVLQQDDDVAKLRQLVRDERKAVQRDRYRVVLLAAQKAADGAPEMTRAQIAAAVGRSRQFVDEWVGRYRRGGVENLHARKQPGNKPSLTPQQQEAFKTRLLAGPTDADGGVCTLRGRDAQRVLEVEFGVPLKLSAVYEWMHRVGLSCLKPRPRHRKNDEQVMKTWLEQAPLLSARRGRITRASRSRSGSRTRRGSDSKGR